MDRKRRLSEMNDEPDTLDAFMASLGSSSRSTKSKNKSGGQRKKRRRKKEIDDAGAIGERMDILVEDSTEDWVRKDESPDSDNNEPDPESNTNSHRSSMVSEEKYIDESIVSRTLIKDTYDEHAETILMTQREAADLRVEWKITVRGHRIPKPCVSFAHMNLSPLTIAVISAKQFSEPSAVQRQAIPVLLSGRDCLALANTGTGKTEAYLWPMIQHILAQPLIENNPHPSSLVLCPTRELCEQAARMILPYTRAHKSVRNLRLVALHGQSKMHAQKRKLDEGCDIIVTTPGRLLDLIGQGYVSIKGVSYLVMDECDKLLSLGFEKQVKDIVNQTRSDRQSALVSATLNSKVESLAKSCLDDPVRVIVGGTIGAVDSTVIRQRVFVLDDQLNSKKQWLRDHLPVLLSEFTSDNNALIFCGSKSTCDDCARVISQMDISVGVIHGDKLQSDRSRVISDCRSGDRCRVLVATDIASRGLDVSTLRIVINFDCAVNVDSHVHRIGRVGRKSQPRKGLAITLLAKDNERDMRFAPKLKRHLRLLGEIVPPELDALLGKSNQHGKSKRSSTKSSSSQLNSGSVDGTTLLPTLTSSFHRASSSKTDW